MQMRKNVNNDVSKDPPICLSTTEVHPRCMRQWFMLAVFFWPPFSLWHDAFLIKKKRGWLFRSQIPLFPFRLALGDLRFHKFSHPLTNHRTTVLVCFHFFHPVRRLQNSCYVYFFPWKRILFDEREKKATKKYFNTGFPKYRNWNWERNTTAPV